MFLCKGCIPEKAKWLFMPVTSYGRCEDCGKTAVCVDYHGDFKEEEKEDNEN